MNTSKTKVLSEFHKSAGELVRISLTEYRRKRYIDFRIYFDSGQGEAADWKPRIKGVCISADLLDELREGLERAATEVQGKNKPSGLGKKGEDNGQTHQKDFEACMNGGGQGPDDSAGAETPREGSGGERK